MVLGDFRSFHVLVTTYYAYVYIDLVMFWGDLHSNFSLIMHIRIRSC